MRRFQSCRSTSTRMIKAPCCPCSAAPRTSNGAGTASRRSSTRFEHAAGNTGGLSRKTSGDMNIGITGHQRLKNPSAWTEVRTRLGKLLDDAEKPLIGLTSLAIGADQLFAEAVLGCGGMIEAIIPFDGY